MARIDKMRIQGIRSFGPGDENAQNITFFSPITCIVGENGSGKTTIIECLRYATTGNVPSGTNLGKSFVYDPKLTNSGEVKGQVKLQFVNIKGEKMLVTRTMQVTQRLGKLEIKSVDPLLNMFDADGNITSVGGRCTDIKKLVLTNIGVSEAILDNVIFCHQEDSLWPLDEGKKVKEKFDDIFDAAKYNKASDAILKLQKAKQAELSGGKIKLGFLEDKHHDARRKRDDLDRNIAKHASIMARQDQLEREKKPLIENYKKTVKQESEFNNLQAKIAAKENEKSNLEQFQKDLKRNITHLHKGSKEELIQIQRDFQKQIKIKEAEIVELEGQVARLMQQERDGLRRITDEQKTLGKMQKDEENHKETVQARYKALHELAKELKLHGLVGEEPVGKEMENALKEVEAGVRAKKNELQNLIKEQQLEEKELQDVIYDKRTKRDQVVQKTKILETQLRDSEKQLNETRKEINQVDLAVKQINTLEASLKRADTEYEEVQQQMNCEETQSQIRDTQKERNRLEDQVQALDAEVEVLQKASKLQAEADVHKASLASKKNEMADLKRKRHDDLLLLFNNIPERNLQRELEGSIRENEKNIKHLRNDLELKQTLQTKMETDAKHLQRKIEDAEELMQKNLSAIQKECKDKDFDTTLNELEDTLRKAQDQKGVLDSSEVLFRRYISSLKQKDPCCPLCHRNFQAAKETEKLIAELHRNLDTLPSQKIDVNKSLDELKARQSRLLQLKPAQTKAAELQAKEIPGLREELDNVQMLITTTATECGMLRTQLKDPENKLAVGLALRSDVALLEQHENEAKRLEREIQRIEQNLPQTGSGSSLQEAQDELKRLRSEIQTMQRQAENKQRELDAHRKKVAELREARNTIQEKLLEVQKGAQKRSQLMDRVRDLENQNSQLRDDVDEISAALQPANEELDDAERAKQVAQTRNRDVQEEKRGELTKVQNRNEALRNLHTAVVTYEARGMATKFEALKASVSKLEKEREESMTKCQEKRTRIEELNSDISKQEIRKRELDDNLKLMEKRESYEKVVLELEKLQAELGNHNFDALLQEKERLSREVNQIDAELNQERGRQEGIATVIADIETELERDDLKNAETYYKKQLIKNTVLKHVISDLMKYFKALNQAMIHFHEERMEAVNRIIRELWVSIYKGSDIDYIAIKTDSDQTMRTTTTRRTYNYRVVMVKRDTELDMRGRCSAGQKMLASLVIRIALAETFSANCGILALDEPTTNLDHSNIDSLCAALTELVQNHRFQNNFQLVVITHDENFINQLTQAGLVNHFYRVARDEEAHSVITKYRVADMD